MRIGRFFLLTPEQLLGYHVAIGVHRARGLQGPDGAVVYVCGKVPDSYRYLTNPVKAGRLHVSSWRRSFKAIRLPRAAVDTTQGLLPPPDEPLARTPAVPVWWRLRTNVARKRAQERQNEGSYTR